VTQLAARPAASGRVPRRDAHPDFLLADNDTTPETESKRSESVGVAICETDIVDAPDERGRERAQPEEDGSGDGEERGQDVVDRGTSTGLASVGGRRGAHGFLASAEHCRVVEVGFEKCECRCVRDSGLARVACVCETGRMQAMRSGAWSLTTVSSGHIYSCCT